MVRQVIIGITGMPASGKSTCSEHIAKHRGVKHIMISDYIWNWLRQQGIKKSTVTGAMFGLYLHTIYQSTPIIRWTKKQIKENKNAKVILLDAVRTIKKYYKLKKKYPNFVMVAVVASPEKRKDREIARARFGELITEDSFLMRDAEELKIGVGEVIAMADYYIDGNLSKKEMLEETDKVYNAILRKFEDK